MLFAIFDEDNDGNITFNEVMTLNSRPIISSCYTDYCTDDYADYYADCQSGPATGVDPRAGQDRTGRDRTGQGGTGAAATFDLWGWRWRAGMRDCCAVLCCTGVRVMVARYICLLPTHLV